MTATIDKALIIQTVSIDLAVAIEANEADLGIPLDDLRERIEQHVKDALKGWPALNKSVQDVTARRGPSSYAYYGPEHRAHFEDGNPDIMKASPPLRVTLTTLGFKES